MKQTEVLIDIILEMAAMKILVIFLCQNLAVSYIRSVVILWERLK